uniref:Uncharacterized protein n=1 Tax=Oryza punctata TaxID=4537 RepID=A0A0E0KZT1_ORYPU
MWLVAKDRVDSASDGGMVSYDVRGAFMRVNLLLLNEQMWEAGSKWKTQQSKFVTFETWGDTRKI